MATYEIYIWSQSRLVIRICKGYVGIYFFICKLDDRYTNEFFKSVFWTLSTLRTWERTWIYVGIGGTIILIIIWIITRFPDNPITGRNLPVNSMGVAIEVFQIAFIVLCSLIIARGLRKGVNKKQV